MKKYLLNIIFVAIALYACNSAYAQTLPKNFKISPSIKLNKTQAVSDNKIVFGSPVRSVVTASNIISNFISDIIVVGDTIWFGTGKGVCKTYDNGNNFMNYYGSAPFGTDDVAGIAVYNNWVVVSTAISETINGADVPTGTGIKVSSDYGNTWNAYPQPMEPDTSQHTIIYGNNTIYALPIVVPEDNLSYDISITRKNLTTDSIVIWIASWAGEFRKSIDNGRTFSRVLLPPDNLDSIYPGGTYNFQYNPRDPSNGGNDNHKGFSVCSENDSTIYVGTANGINKSTDWGISWRKYSYKNTGLGSGISGDFVVALKPQKYGGKSIIWGATNIGDNINGEGQFAAVSYTTNQGANWANTLKDDAVFSHNFGFKDSVVYVATDNGIWRSYFAPGNFGWSSPSVIYDEELRDQIHTTLFYSAGAQSDSVWVGSGDGLCRTVDSSFSPWVNKWKIFRAVHALSSTTDTYAAPNPFQPNLEVCRIFFKTGKAGANVTVKIFDFGMNYVRTVLQNAQRSETNVIWTTWDGRRDDGMQVANGVYFYRIEIDKQTVSWGKILVLQ